MATFLLARGTSNLDICSQILLDLDLDGDFDLDLDLDLNL